VNISIACALPAAVGGSDLSLEQVDDLLATGPAGIDAPNPVHRATAAQPSRAPDCSWLKPRATPRPLLEATQADH